MYEYIKYTYIKQIELDKTKRHFVVGDMHGRFEAFERLLDSVNYDPTTDIIYSVGDVIDRGHQSYEAVVFFNQPNTHCIMGNHEYMVTDKDWYNCWMQNGGIETLISLGDWGMTIGWLEKWCRKLPFVLDVGDVGDPNAFRLMHAEHPLNWSEATLQRQLEYAAEHGGDGGIENIIWSRTAINAALKNVAEMKPAAWEIPVHNERSGRNIFCGHTPVNNVIKLHDMTFIDTWKSKTLTMVNALTKEVHSVKVPYKDFKTG